MKNLNKINWDFSDFNSAKYPFDLNSIPWYPATFISPIPRSLIASLSNVGDVVLDPFGGKGTTAIETALQNRIPLYSDLNPFIAENTKGLFAAIEYVLCGDQNLSCEKELVDKLVSEEKDIDSSISKYHVSNEVFDWFHKNTVRELMAIIESIYLSIEEENHRCELIKKLAFSAILKSASSQKGHFTYVTDNCKPKKTELKEKAAIQLYSDKVDQILKAAEEFVVQYKLMFPEGKLDEVLQKRRVITGDAKDLAWIKNNSVDLVVTSPPYLCSQDYIKTMRLMNLFFENEQAFTIEVKREIGARASRSAKSEIVVPQFYNDMSTVFANISRVLKQEGIFALIVGQGKSKVTSQYDIISDLIGILEKKYDFHLIFRKERQIGNRVIQVGGVDKESILILSR